MFSKAKDTLNKSTTQTFSSKNSAKQPLIEVAEDGESDSMEMDAQVVEEGDLEMDQLDFDRAREDDDDGLRYSMHVGA